MSRRKRRKGWDAQTRGGPIKRWVDESVVPAGKARRERKPVIKDRLPGVLYSGDTVTLVFIDRDGKRSEQTIKL